MKNKANFHGYFHIVCLHTPISVSTFHLINKRALLLPANNKKGNFHKGTFTNLHKVINWLNHLREGRELLLHLLILNCFQLKITLKINAKVVCLGVATLIPFSSKCNEIMLKSRSLGLYILCTFPLHRLINRNNSSHL